MRNIETARTVELWTMDYGLKLVVGWYFNSGAPRNCKSNVQTTRWRLQVEA